MSVFQPHSYTTSDVLWQWRINAIVSVVFCDRGHIQFFRSIWHTPCVFLTLLRGGGRGRRILAFGQAPNGESNDVNHTEPELFLEAVNDMQV
jgi:hypothetical protein